MDIESNIEGLRAAAQEIRSAVMPKSVTPEMVGLVMEGILDKLDEILEQLEAEKLKWADMANFGENIVNFINEQLELNEEISTGDVITSEELDAILNDL